MKKQKNVKKQNLIGAAIMIVLILLAMPLGVAHSLEDLREDAEWQFYEDRTGFSICDSLDNRREAAHNLLTVANRYTDDHPNLMPYFNELEYQFNASENAYSESHQIEAEANYQMGEAAEELADALGIVGLSEKDEQYRVQLIAQMRSEQDKIQRSGYNAAAREFNNRLYVFPVNVLKNFTDVEGLFPFDEPHASDVVEDTLVQELAPEYFAEETVTE